jgi:ion channel
MLIFATKHAFCLVSPDFLQLDVFSVGTATLIFLTLLHAAGLYGANCHYTVLAQRLRDRHRHLLEAALLFGWVVLLFVMLHVLETFIWATLLYKLHLVPKFRDAFYFSANSYTTLGYGEVLLPQSWRELSPLIAISGLFTFGFTTSALVDVVGENNRLVKDLAIDHRRRKQGLTGLAPSQPRAAKQSIAQRHREIGAAMRSKSRRLVSRNRNRRKRRIEVALAASTVTDDMPLLTRRQNFLMPIVTDSTRAVD